MSLYKRGKWWHVDLRWRGYPRIRTSCETSNKARARSIHRTLEALRDAGRRDLLELVHARRLHVVDLHEAYLKGSAALMQLQAKAESPALGPLVEEWIEWMRSPAGISPRRKRRYAPRSIERYGQSMEAVFEVLTKGRQASLSDLTEGFVSEFRRSRKRATGGRERKPSDKPLNPATLNRDLAALGALLTWCERIKGLTVVRPRMTRERESKGRIRFLSSDELRRFQAECPPEWWVYFGTKFFTGLRDSEMRRLRGLDVLLRERRLTVHEGEEQAKTPGSVRDVPIPTNFLAVLSSHLTVGYVGPDDLVFPGPFQDNGASRRVWDRVCQAARIAGATPRDTRHTFGVHAAMAAIPITELMELMGHTSVQTTLRYMRFAPGSRLSEDADRIYAQMQTDHDADVRRGSVLKGA